MTEEKQSQRRTEILSLVAVSFGELIKASFADLDPDRRSELDRRIDAGGLLRMSCEMRRSGALGVTLHCDDELVLDAKFEVDDSGLN